MKAIVTFECSDALLGLDITPVEFLGLQASRCLTLKPQKLIFINHIILLNNGI